MPRSAAMTALAVALVNELGSEPGREWLTPLKDAVSHFEKSPPPPGNFAVAADHLGAACDLALNQEADADALECDELLSGATDPDEADILMIR